MSTRGAGVFLHHRLDEATIRSHRTLMDRFKQYSPSQGWTTFGLLLLALLVVGESVNAAEWVESSGLVTVLLWSAITGLLLSKLRAPWFLLIPAGTLLGVVAVIWQTSARSVEGEDAIERIREMFQRLDLWWDAAYGGGISTDLLPFTLMLISLGWIAGFFSTWFIFRRSNVWVAVILLGTAILTNLSFLPEKFGSRFFLFLFIVMLLIVRVSTVQMQAHWERLNIRFTQQTGWLALHVTVWFSVIVILAAAFMPLNVYTNSTAAQVWNIGRAPVTATEDFFARLFAALPSKKDTPGRFFGKWLPFIGKISFGGEPVGWATTSYPSYWLSQTYNEYTPRGWIATESEPIEVGPDLLPPARRDNLKRESEIQMMQLDFASEKFLSGGDFNWVSEPAVVESLAPRKFIIDMDDPSADLSFPLDVRELADGFRFDLRGLSEDTARAMVGRRLPDDLLIVEMQVDSSDSVESVVLQRKAPITPELVSWKFAETIEKNDPYRMVSYVSLATNDELREASTDYGSFITDHYLQLPPAFPERIRALAERITAGRDTPLDKALAIERYMRGPEFTYSQDIDAPPSDMDGVEWFLFESSVGYSDYFASSMAVMLRAVGVPTRMAAGYAPGELNEDGQRVIRDSDSHGWVQAYFPDYGWIDFEPTPNWPEHERLPLPVRSFPGVGGESSEGDPDELVDPFDVESDVGLFPGGNSVSSGPFISVEDLIRYLIPAGIVAAVVAGAWIVWSVIWNLGLGSLGAESRLYTKLTRLGWLAGIGRKSDQTPIEYGARIGRTVPDANDGAIRIAETYAAHRYGGRQADEDEQGALLEAWKDVRFKLVGRMFRRLIPQPSQEEGA